MESHNSENLTAALLTMHQQPLLTREVQQLVIIRLQLVVALQLLLLHLRLVAAEAVAAAAEAVAAAAEAVVAAVAAEQLRLRLCRLFQLDL
jgi:hypothetical protein